MTVVIRVLWAFDVVPLKDEMSKSILPSRDDFTNSLIIQPKPFKYSLIPRKANVNQVIMADAELSAIEAAAWMT